MDNSKKKMIVTVLVICLAITIPLAGYVTASYLLTSNHIKGSTNAYATLTLTANNTDVTFNDTLRVVAHLNDSKAGIPIQFFNGSTALNPIINTDTSGNAVVYYTVAEYYDLSAQTNHP